MYLQRPPIRTTLPAQTSALRPAVPETLQVHSVRATVGRHLSEIR